MVAPDRPTAAALQGRKFYRPGRTPRCRLRNVRKSEVRPERDCRHLREVVLALDASPSSDENGGVAWSTSVSYWCCEPVGKCGVGASRHPRVLLRARTLDSSL